MLFPNNMTYDKLHRTSSFWTIGIPVFIKLIYGYTYSFVFQINFGLLWLTPASILSCKKIGTKPFIKNLAGAENVIFRPLKVMNGILFTNGLVIYLCVPINFMLFCSQKIKLKLWFVNINIWFHKEYILPDNLCFQLLLLSKQYADFHIYVFTG